MKPGPKQTALNLIALVLCLLLVSRTLGKLPAAWNWDVMGYMGLALEWESNDPNEVHAGVYAAAKAELPLEVFQAHTQGSDVLKARYADPAIYTEHIAFYRARVLPTFVMSLMHRAGMPLSQSVWWLALGSFAATGLLILIWLARWLPFWWACVSATLLMHAPPLLGSASMATVDSFGTLLICIGAYLLLERKAYKSGAFCFTLSILARPDSVILIGILAIFLFLMGRRGSEPHAQRPSLRFYGVWLAASGAAYLAVNAHAQAYGWWPLFQISFGQKVVHPSELASSPDWAAWWEVIQGKLGALPVDSDSRARAMRVGYWGTPRLVTGSAFVFVYCGFAALALGLWKRVPRPALLQRHAAFLMALLATYFLRWFLFPQLWDRFFAPLYVLVPLCLLSMAALALEPAEDPELPSQAS